MCVHRQSSASPFVYCELTSTQTEIEVYILPQEPKMQYNWKNLEQYRSSWKKAFFNGEVNYGENRVEHENMKRDVGTDLI